MTKQTPAASASAHPRFLVLGLIGLVALLSSLVWLRDARPALAQDDSALIPDIIVFSEDFDGVTAPALPAGWTTSVSGQIQPFRTVTTFPDSAPNAVFTNDPKTQGTADLVSPSIALGNLQHKLTFRHFYQTDYEFDGAVLDISINGGGFQDIVNAGGSFISGGYDTTLIGGSLSGRRAWTGQMAGYITTEVNLPPGTANQSIRLRWRLGTDPMEAGTGWRIDNVQISNNISGLNQNSISIPASGSAAPYPSEINLTNHEGLVTGVQVSLTNFTHNSPDDVDLMLVAPNGSRVILMSDVGGTNPVNNLSLMFMDAAAASLPDNSTITNGSYKPTNFEPGDAFPAPAPGGAPTGARLSSLNGITANGVWQLFLVDDNGNNAGSINGGWTLFVQSSADAVGIPEMGAAQPYASEKRLSGIQGTVTKATVTLSNFSHTSPDDVDVMLVAPNGRRIVLMSDVGGNTEVGGLELTFDDMATNTLPDAAQLASGTYKPTDFEPGDAFPLPAPQGQTTGTTLNAFFGSAPTGIWKLFVVDDTGANAGSIAGSWSITLQTSTTACAFTLTPPVQSFPITGGSGSFTVNMPSTCSWSATTNSSFITIDSSASGSGSGTISFSVSPNMTGGRSGSIEVTNGAMVRSFQIQQPSGCPFALDQTALNFGAAGGNGNVGVTAGAICGWQATTTAPWVQITSAPQSGNGTLSFTVQPNPSSTARSTTVTVGARSININQAGAAGRKFDFDGDGKADVSVFRPTGGAWYILNSSNGSVRSEQFGISGDLITPDDFDGDSKTDIGVFRPSTGYRYLINSSDNTLRAVQFGQAGDAPVSGDFDGDGKADIALYRPSNNTFYLLASSDNSFRFQQWGASGDLPVTGDYDGDSKTDYAIYRPGTATFYILRSSDSTVVGQQWGTTGDRPIAGDFDGDGRTDLAVYRPSNNGWYIMQSSNNSFRGLVWGTGGDIASAADYDGDGQWDVAVFRPTTGTFYILQSTTNALRSEAFGTNGDVPAPSAYVP